MYWYLVHTKPRQEKCALQNLEQQGYPCYLPVIPLEKICHGSVKVTDEPLFPRYLFIRLGQGAAAKSWAPIRSTKGVSCLVSFGTAPTKVDDGLVDLLRAQEAAMHEAPERLFTPGERVRLTEGAFSSLQGIYQMADGERRAMVLIEFLSKPVALRVPLSSLCKAS